MAEWRSICDITFCHIIPASIFQSVKIFSRLDLNFNLVNVRGEVSRVWNVLQGTSRPVPLNLALAANLGKCTINTSRPAQNQFSTASFSSPKRKTFQTNPGAFKWRLVTFYGLKIPCLTMLTLSIGRSCAVIGYWGHRSNIFSAICALQPIQKKQCEIYKVNRCLARYSPRATTTNRSTNRAPNACPGQNWPKMPILGQIWSFLGKKS